MSTRIALTPSSGTGSGYRGDLPLERALEEPITVDASHLGSFHPMFAIRLRLFLDWHLLASHEVRLVGPRDPQIAQRLADMGVASHLPDGVASNVPEAAAGSIDALAIRRLETANDVEDAASATIELLHQQVPELVVWGAPVFMAVSELCGNALQHGRDTLGAYVAADRVEGDAAVPTRDRRPRHWDP
jgi:hypothetical protein